MDRVIVYPSAIPEDTDILNTNRNGMIALGYAMEAAFGTSTFVSGLTATPFLSGLGVTIGRGMISQLSTIDNTAYGSLAADTSDALLKQGINISSTSVTLSAPVTSGYSQNFLIEAQLLEQDTGSNVLPYYNSSNPSQPYSGPSNSGEAQNTLRVARVSLQSKAGTAAPANTQNTPGADNGWVPLYVVTVNAGETTISTSQIAQAAGAPFIGALLTQINRKLQGNTTIYVSPYGNDLNGGLLASDALQTIQAASNKISSSIDMNGYGITISLAANSNYAPATFSGLPTGFGPNSFITITGSSAQIVSTSASVGALNIVNGANVQIGAGVTLSGTIGLQIYPGGTAAIVGSCTFGACSGDQILANGGVLSLKSGFVIGGSAVSLIAAENLGQVYVGPGVNITTPGSLTYSGAIISCIGPAYVQLAADMTFGGTGSYTGKKFDVSQNGVISSAGVGASLLPGTVTGTYESGGQFI